MSASATESAALAAPSAEAPTDLLSRALALVGDDMPRAERELGHLLHSEVEAIPRVAGHLALAGGKRLRPLLTLLCARAAGFDDPCRITIAACAELLHTATLLHDDVIDGGEFRRGRAAARVAHGNGLAVLSGDFCLARALGAVARLGRPKAFQTLADTVTAMAEGEVQQLDNAGRESLDTRTYYEIIERKTAALLSWCATVAGLAAPPWCAALHRAGLELGFAFQIADDVLDYRANTGKDPGQDLRDGKMTLPLILACEDDAALAKTVHGFLRAGPPADRRVADAIGAAVAQSTGPGRAAAVASSHAARAREALMTLPASPARAALCEVTHYIVRRTL